MRKNKITNSPKEDFEKSMDNAFIVNQQILESNSIAISGVTGIYAQGFDIRFGISGTCVDCGTVDLRFRRIGPDVYRIIEMLPLDEPRLLYDNFPELPIGCIAPSIIGRVKGLVPSWDFRDCPQCRNLEYLHIDF